MITLEARFEDGLVSFLLDFNAQHHGCFSIRNCCCGPKTEPGRQIRIQAILSAAVNSNSFINQQAMSVPVRPRPA